MTVISKITPEQVARFGEWAEEWIKIGLSTDPADFDKATEAALRAYAYCNLGRPKIVLRMSSPYGATVGGALALDILRNAGTQVESQVWSQVWSQVESQVWSQVESQVGSQVRSQVWSQVWSQVESQVRSQVESQVGSQVRSGVSNNRGGAFWAPWGAYISFMRDVLGWRGDTLESFSVDEHLIKSCGWVWWHEDVLAISDRPCEIHRDAQGRLHCETGPAIAYRDGWCIHSWHGVVVPAEWVETKGALTAKDAITWKNIEQRRAACEIVGWYRILSELNARTINKHKNPQVGELVEVDLPDVGRERFLRVHCGTGREFALPVPRKMKTAIAAQAWTWGLSPKEFSIPEVRT